jgi:hypothetical protein
MAARGNTETEVGPEDDQIAPGARLTCCQLLAHEVEGDDEQEARGRSRAPNSAT